MNVPIIQKERERERKKVGEREREFRDIQIRTQCKDGG
jgi:hypothetical protein